MLVGTPKSVGERLRALQQELGIDGILAELNCGGLIPHRQVMTALRLLCEEVMPQLQSPAPEPNGDLGSPLPVETSASGAGSSRNPPPP